ncbi:MAG: transcriptional regulator [Planctomycetota bacterium]
MDDQTFQTKLAALMSEISTLPPTERAKLQKLADATKDRRDKVKQSIGELQESLDYLRLSIKYLVFDLEATRRENQYLRDMIQEQQAEETGDADLGLDHDDTDDDGHAV